MEQDLSQGPRRKGNGEMARRAWRERRACGRPPIAAISRASGRATVVQPALGVGHGHGAWAWGMGMGHGQGHGHGTGVSDNTSLTVGSRLQVLRR